MHDAGARKGRAGGVGATAARKPEDAIAAQAHVSILGIETMDPDALVPPEYYPKDAKSMKVFRDLARSVARAMSLQPEHADMIAACCIDQMEVARLREYVAKHGYTYRIKTQNGDFMYRERPEAKTLANCQRRVQVYLIEFGLTPLAWARNIAKAVKDGLIEPPAKKGAAKPDSKFAKFRR